MTPADEDKVFNGGVRQTDVALRVSWDPATQDHPGGWDWSTLLDCEVDVLDFEDKE